MSTTAGMPRKERNRIFTYQIGQIVWAKLKGYPMWPALVVDPSERSDLKRPKKRNHCVKFFGSEDYSFVAPEDMKPYFLYKSRFIASSKKSNFAAALRNVDYYIKFNPRVKDMEAEYKKPGDDQLYQEWKRDTGDDETASDYSEEINESARVDQPNAAASQLQSALSFKERKPIGATPGHIPSVSRKISTEVLPVVSDPDRAVSAPAVVVNEPLLDSSDYSEEINESASVDQEPNAATPSQPQSEINESARVDQPANAAAAAPQLQSSLLSKKRKRISATQPQSYLPSKKRKRIIATSGHIRSVSRKKSTEALHVATDFDRAVSTTSTAVNEPVLEMSDYSEEINELVRVDQPNAVSAGFQSQSALPSKKRKRISATPGRIRSTSRKTSTEALPGSDSDRALFAPAVVNDPVLEMNHYSEEVNEPVSVDQQPDAAASQRQSALPSKKRFGFVGIIDDMGSAILNKFIEAEYEMVLCFKPGKNTVDFHNCEIVETPADVVDRCDLIMSYFDHSEEALQTLTDRRLGILEKLGPTKSYIELSTVDFGTALEIDKLVRERHSRYLEAAMIGTAEGADNRKLLFVCTGDKSLFHEAANNYLRVVGYHALFFGEAGYGTVIRLMHQMLKGTVMAAVAETMMFANRCGFDLSDMADVIEKSELGNPMIMEAVRRISNKEFSQSTFSLTKMHRDLQCAVNFANNHFSLQTILGSAACQLYLMAKNNGLADVDYSAIFKIISEKNPDDGTVHVNE